MKDHGYFDNSDKTYRLSEIEKIFSNNIINPDEMFSLMIKSWLFILSVLKINLIEENDNKHRSSRKINQKSKSVHLLGLDKIWVAKYFF